LGGSWPFTVFQRYPPPTTFFFFFSRTRSVRDCACFLPPRCVGGFFEEFPFGSLGLPDLLPNPFLSSAVRLSGLGSPSEGRPSGSRTGPFPGAVKSLARSPVRCCGLSWRARRFFCEVEPWSVPYRFSPYPTPFVRFFVYIFRPSFGERQYGLEPLACSNRFRFRKTEHLLPLVSILSLTA